MRENITLAARIAQVALLAIIAWQLGGLKYETQGIVGEIQGLSFVISK